MEWNLTGHEWAATLLQQHIARGETRHAYLFTGPAGVGRRTLALRFAQAVNCQQPPAPGQFCGTCRPCQQIERMQQLDLAIVQSEPPGGSLQVDAVRELQRSLSLAPYEAKYRVALLLRFQEATASAQNALLKTLEEAPDKAILLLTADSGEVLLPTIVSRCEVLRLRPLPVETVQAALQSRGCSLEQARLLAHISGGRPGYALRLSQDPALLSQREERLDMLWELLHANLRERFSYAEQEVGSKDGKKEDRGQAKEQLRETMLAWLGLWRDVLLRGAGASTPLTNIDRAEQIDEIASRVDLSGARRQVEQIEDKLARLGTANLQLLVETMLMDMPRLR